MSASVSLLVEISLKVCESESSLSNSFFTFSNNNKFAGFKISGETFSSLPGLTNAINGVTFSFNL